MHLIKDENGNVIPHGNGHDHDHEHHHHHHDHDHEHSHECDHQHCDSCQGEHNCKDETVALLTYMLQHNEHHAAELEQMAENLKKLEMDAAAKTIMEGVADFQKGNMRLSLALTLVKEQLKEDE